MTSAATPDRLNEEGQRDLFSKENISSEKDEWIEWKNNTRRDLSQLESSENEPPGLGLRPRPRFSFSSSSNPYINHLGLKTDTPSSTNDYWWLSVQFLLQFAWDKLGWHNLICTPYNYAVGHFPNSSHNRWAPTSCHDCLQYSQQNSHTAYCKCDMSPVSVFLVRKVTAFSMQNWVEISS